MKDQKDPCPDTEWCGLYQLGICDSEYRSGGCPVNQAYSSNLIDDNVTAGQSRAVREELG